MGCRWPEVRLSYPYVDADDPHPVHGSSLSQVTLTATNVLSRHDRQYFVQLAKGAADSWRTAFCPPQC